MELLTKRTSGKKERPIKIIQFGEGNFLRGFADYMIDIANEKNVFNGDIVIVKPREHGNIENFYAQECQYTVSLRGLINGKATIQNRIITSVTDIVSSYNEYEKYISYSRLSTLRFIISNTTESGIVYDSTDELSMRPPKSFPGKLAQFLYERFKFFKGSPDKGLIILPVELIDDNGNKLKEIVLKLSNQWKLEEEFRIWLNESCVFCSTLVDRIITGYPKDEADNLCNEWGYLDNLIVAGEPYASWVIECPKSIETEFPLHKAELPVIFTENLKPYIQRKVRILNGAHTSFALASYLAGNDLVIQSMNDQVIFNFIHDLIFDEIIPTLSLPKSELVQFALDVFERFRNPYVKHRLLSISLNSVSKWKSRCLPSFLDFIKINNELPFHLTFSMAALIAFYKGNEIKENVLIGHRNGIEYEISDDLNVLNFFSENFNKEPLELTANFLSNVDFFGIDMSKIKGFVEKVSIYLNEINDKGMKNALETEFKSIK